METYWSVFQKWCLDKEKKNMDEYDFACWLLIENRMGLEKSAQRFYDEHLKPSENVPKAGAI